MHDMMVAPVRMPSGPVNSPAMDAPKRAESGLAEGSGHRPLTLAGAIQMGQP